MKMTSSLELFLIQMVCMNLCCFLMVLFALHETWCSIAGDLSEDAVMKMEKQQHLLLSASSPAISKTMTD